MKTIKILILLTVINIFSYIAYAIPKDYYVIITPSELNFQVIDPLGRITGYDIQSGTIIKNIPNTSYYLEVEPTGPFEATKYQKAHSVGPRIISDATYTDSGRYKIKLFGSTTPETFNAEIRIFYPNLKGAQMIAEYNALIYPNTIWTYEFTIPDVPTATGEIILTKVAQPLDLITDLTTAGHLGYIGNPHFVSETIEKINEIEKERAKPAEKDDDHKLTPAQKAKKEYTELLGEITEKYNKPESDEFVKKEAYDVLKEDLEYIIGHIL